MTRLHTASRQLALFLVLALLPLMGWGQSIRIARSKALNSTVTVSGIALNGAELGNIRYIFDDTAAIAIFGTNLANVKRGDSLTATGKLYDFNGLLEISPVSSVTVHSSNRPLPAPKLASMDTLGEADESWLVRINNAMFLAGGSTIAGNTDYLFVANGHPGQIYVRNGSPLVGTFLPASPVTLTGLCSQYTDEYQVLPRDTADINPGSGLYFTAPVSVSNITTSGFKLQWATSKAATSKVKYGLTPALELGDLAASTTGNTHTVILSGLNPATIVYAQATSFSGTDTVNGLPGTYCTASLSSGKMTVYFNRTVDTTVATTVKAKQLFQAIDDTLIAYIGRAKQTIDFAIYNLNNQNLSDMSGALNAAQARGVQVRVVYCTSTNNAGIANLSPTIPKVESPNKPAYRIMHNKFLVIDANSSNPNDPLVWTGSTNLTQQQVNTDANNVVIVQDQSLAKAYQIEFNEMFGSSTATPDTNVSRFGKYKLDNTPHEFVIGGKRVESYFSPSDATGAQILRTIQNTRDDAAFFVMAFTRAELANGIIKQVTDNNLFARGMVNDTSGASKAIYQNLLQNLGSRYFGQYKGTGILHHKYYIGDFMPGSADPLVITGSHNWTASADQYNDENTLIIHDEAVANQYYQEFSARMASDFPVSREAASTRSAELPFSIAPNPASSMVRFLPTEALSGGYDLELVSMDGRVLYFHRQHDGTAASIDVSQLPSAVYMLNVWGAGQRFTVPVLRQ